MGRYLYGIKGNDKSKNLATQEVKDYYKYGDFEQQDIIDIVHGTSKEDELYDYAYIPDYHKTYNEDKDIADDLGTSLWNILKYLS